MRNGLLFDTLNPTLTPKPPERTPYLDFDPPVVRSDDPLEQAAILFHQENPHVLREIARVCLTEARRGKKRWSINAAFEVVRYNHRIATTGEPYKLSNNHRAFYARWLMRDIPELDGFFVIKLRRHEEEDDE